MTTRRPILVAAAAVTILTTSLTITGPASGTPAAAADSAATSAPSATAAAPSDTRAAKRGKLRIPALKPAIPLVLTTASGTKTTYPTKRARTITLPVGGYRLTAKKTVRGKTAAVANDGYLAVRTGKTTRVRIKVVPATGTLTIRLTNVPRGTKPTVTVTGPGKYRAKIHATKTLRGLRAGTYKLTATSVRIPGGGAALGAINRTSVPLKTAGRETATVDYRNHTSVPTWTDYATATPIPARVPSSVTGPGTWDGTLLLPAARLTGAKAGDAVILQPSKLLPLGYVGQVTAITGTQATVRSVPLPELIPNLQVPIHLDPAQVATYSKPRTRAVNGINECTAGFPPFQMPSIEATTSYEGSEPDNVQAYASWQLKLPLTPTAEASCELGIEGKTAVPGLGVEIPGGIAGLYVYWNVKLFAKVTSPSLTATIPLTQPIPLKTGFIWDADSGGRTLNGPDGEGPGPQITPPNVTISAGISGEIGIRAGEEINWEIAGATILDAHNYLSVSGVVTPAGYLELPSKDDATGQTCFARFYAKVDVHAIVKAVSKNQVLWWSNDNEVTLLDATLYTTDDLLERHLWCWTPAPASPPAGPDANSTYYAFKQTNNEVTLLGITGDYMWGMFAAPQSEFAWFTAQRIDGTWVCTTKWGPTVTTCHYTTFTGGPDDLQMQSSLSATTTRVAGPVTGVAALDAALRAWDAAHPRWQDKMGTFGPYIQRGIDSRWDNGASY